MGPIAAPPTFQIIGDYLNTSIKQETIIVRNNAKIRAVSNFGHLCYNFRNKCTTFELIVYKTDPSFKRR